MESFLAHSASNEVILVKQIVRPAPYGDELTHVLTSHGWGKVDIQVRCK